MLIYWIIFLLYIEMYSLGMLFFLKKNKEKNYGLCMIPFASFIYLKKYLNEYSILGIRIKSLFKIAISFTIVCFICCLFIILANNNLKDLPIEDQTRYATQIKYLKQIMLVPIIFCLFIFIINLAKSTSDLLFKYKCHFKMDFIVSLLLLPIPFLIKNIKIKEE